MTKSVPKNNTDYTVAWICVLQIEMAAALTMLDEIHDQSPTLCESKTQYIRGSIENHNIVVMCLGGFGDPPPDVAAAELTRCFPCIQLGLLVGIGAGIPTRNADIRLGDVVVGTTHIDLDFGRRYDGKFRRQVGRAQIVRAKSHALDAALANVKENHKGGHRAFARYLSSITHGAPDRVSGFSHPDEEDCLFAAAYTHVGGMSTCDACDKSHTVSRVPRPHGEPVVHYGPIASSNPVLKDAISRDRLADELAVFCVETGATGVTGSFPSLIIRGICDYADSHKNDNWQGYAAAAAAAYTKELVLALPGSRTVDSDQSDTDSIFSMRSSLSSQSSQAQLTSIAAIELAGLLLEDSELSLLYPHAIVKAGPYRFERRLRRLIRRYGRNLQDEVLTIVHRQAASFVQGSARRTALEVRRALVQDTRQLHLDRMLGLDHATKINAWLESQKKNPDKRHTRALNSSNAEGSDDDFSDDEENGNGPVLDSLNGVKEFLVATEAFTTLRREFRNWLDAEGGLTGKRSHQGPGVDTEANMAHDGISLYASLRRRLMDIVSPPPEGYQRIHYECVGKLYLEHGEPSLTVTKGCGDSVYLHVREVKPGGIENLQQRLLGSVSAVRTQSSPGCTSLTPPPQAHLGSSSSTSQIGTSLGSGRHQPHLPVQPPQWAGPRLTTMSRTATQIREDQFLLLCLNTRTSTALVNLEVGSLTGDQYLFERIREEYQRMREEHEFRISDTVPLWVRVMLRSISSRLTGISPSSCALQPSKRLLKYVTSGIRFNKVTSGDFVRFQLVPIGTSCCPRWFKAREMPPETEVRARRYLYEPVPMDDVEFADIPLAHLLKPGPHTDTFWLKTFPKKVREPLLRQAGIDGQRVIGWGIRINEGLNWTVISLLLLTLVLAIGAAVGVYAAITSDNESAFGLGAFLVAVLGVYLSHQYFAWKEAV